MDVVYMYHNQIDARGEPLATENEVFKACAEAIEEIKKEIKRLSTGANVYRFIITSDHGFIYKRDKLTESDRIALKNDSIIIKERRFIISTENIQDDGIVCLPLS
jgi:hypothetical protein